MKFATIFLVLPIFWAYFVQASSNVRHEFNFGKRADEPTNSTTSASDDTLGLTALIVGMYQSGIIQEFMYNLTSSHENVELIANTTVALLQLDSQASGLLSAFNISINTTEILGSVMESGLIDQLVQGLLLNDTNRQGIAHMIGGVLGDPNYVFIGHLIKGLGEGAALTLDYVVDTITNSESKANTNEDNQSDIRVEMFRKRDDDNSTTTAQPTNSTTSTTDFAGSFELFIGNMVSQLITSDFITSTISQILKAVVDSNVTVPLIMDIAQLPGLGDLFRTTVGAIYRAGLLDNIPFDSYYTYLKEQNIMGEQSEHLFTDPVLGPAIAKIFQQIEAEGNYQRLQDNIYGPRPRN